MRKARANRQPWGTEELLQLLLTKHRALQNPRALRLLGCGGPQQGNCFSMGSSRPLVPQSMDEAGVPWPRPVCVGGTGSSIPAYTPSR